MSVDGAGPNLPPVTVSQPRGQGRAETGVDLNLSGRELRHGAGHGADPRQREGFGRAMQRAKGQTDDAVPDVPVALPLSAFVPVPGDAGAANGAAQAAAGQVHRTGEDGPRAVAERIDRYLRGVEGAASLRQGEGMVVKLPPNALGVSQVSMRMVGDVMEVTLSMQAAVAAEIGMRAQLSQLGRELAQRQNRYGLRLLLDGETVAEEERPVFDPLRPGGRA